MNENNDNNSKQVLSFLNSLGFIDITPSELKLLIKDLKLYRKAKKEKYVIWNQDTNAKNLQKHSCEKHCNSNDCNKYDVNRTISRNFHDESTRIKYQKKNFLEEIENKVKSNISYEKVKIASSLSGKMETTIPKRILIAEKISQPLNIDYNKKCTVEKFSESFENLCGIEESMSKPHFKGKSCTIKSQNSSTEFKTLLINRKRHNDPVTLYNNYKSFWKHLSLPGEESHAALRWSIRQKMMTTNHIPKLMQQQKRKLQTQ